MPVDCSFSTMQIMEDQHKRCCRRQMPWLSFILVITSSSPSLPTTKYTFCTQYRVSYTNVTGVNLDHNHTDVAQQTLM